MSDELKKMSPILSELKKNKIGFKTPESYFNTLENNLLTQIYLKNSIQDTGFNVPENYFDNVEREIKLKLLKQNNFKVPSNYFEKFEMKIEKNDSKPKSKIFTFNKFWVPATVAAIFLISIGINRLNSNTELKVAELENLLESGAMGINSYDLASVYEAELNDLILSDVLGKEEIESYLSDDINEIIYYE